MADLGSNTFHLLIGRLTNGRPEPVFERKAAVGIGRDGMGKRLILPEALDRSITVLKEFTAVLEMHGIPVTEALVLATSAFRNAANSEQALQRIREETGLRPEIISGEREAGYIFDGVQASGALQHGVPSLVMDIGGGSVEFILWDGIKAIWKQSFETGGLRLMEMFHQKDPLSSEAKFCMEDYLEKNLQPLWELVSEMKPLSLAGSSGAFDTLADIRNASESGSPGGTQDVTFQCITPAEFRHVFESVWHLPLQERLQIPGMTAFRAAMMPAALILIRLVLKKIGADTIRVSHYAMKEGAFLSLFSNA